MENYFENLLTELLTPEQQAMLEQIKYEKALNRILRDISEGD